MHKRERLERTLIGEKTDRVAVALWRHFPGDDQRAADLAEATLRFQQRWDFDFVKLTPAMSFSVSDYGVQDQWTGLVDGTRRFTRHIIERSLDWTELRRLDPLHGMLGLSLQALSLVKQGLDGETPFLATVYSPLTQAGFLSGRDTLIQHMRTHPDRLKTGLGILTDNTLRYLDALHKIGISGIFYEMEYAAYNVISQDEYAIFGKPYDQKVLEALHRDWWFNLAALNHRAPMVELVSDYPIHALAWHDRDSHITLLKGKSKFEGTVCGGIGRIRPLHLGMPGEIREQALDAIDQCFGRSLILSASAPILLTTPYANIRTVRQVVEDVTKR